jgi:hypothetical protein
MTGFMDVRRTFDGASGLLLRAHERDMAMEKGRDVRCDAC